MSWTGGQNTGVLRCSISGWHDLSAGPSALGLGYPTGNVGRVVLLLDFSILGTSLMFSS